MKGLPALVWRNTKLFFKDKGMFFTSLITPLILLVLFVTFLGNVYRDSLDMTVADVPGYFLLCWRFAVSPWRSVPIC